MSLKNFLKEAKAQLGSQILEYGVLIVVAVIITQIIQSIQTSVTPTGDLENDTRGAFNISSLGIDGMIQFGDFFVIIAVVLVGSFVIRILRTGF
ncbi:MAG: hypothetical protein CMI54_07760 [Parcubacteria group bacterium]|nr:hypothetical protein [Parcubacteria group bacterium]|tara:strand:+ start:18086 stop:18367 length:282 start_codon:yes stop_codon:yes gene_type:complete